MPGTNTQPAPNLTLLIEGIGALIAQGEKKPNAIIDELIANNGARYRDRGCSTYELRLAGVVATSTSGALGVLWNWQEAARRRIAKEIALEVAE